jgi:hypothetical protein
MIWYGFNSSWIASFSTRKADSFSSSRFVSQADHVMEGLLRFAVGLLESPQPCHVNLRMTAGMDHQVQWGARAPDAE